ncbi:MAG: MFS transporter [Candidatus Bathyarchaeota archaeon]|nr:MFS transporter [Candidatus Bathyarchaeota archaeon]
MSKKRLVLSALMASTMSTYPPQIVIGVLLVEISNTFNVPLGIAGQLRTAISITALIGSLLVSAISEKYSYRNLLITGLLLITSSSILSAFSPNFTTLFTITILTGMGVALTVPMTTTLVGEYYTEGERGRVMSLLGVGGGVAFLLGGTIASLLSDYGGWRSAFLVFAGLIGLAGLILTILFLPKSQARGGESRFIDSLKDISENSNVVKSLMGALLASIAIQGLYLYSFSYLKEVYQTSTVTTGLIYSGTAVFFIAGSYMTSVLIERIGSKNITMLGLLGFSVSTFAYHYAPSLGLVIGFIMAGNLLEALRYNGNNALSLEYSGDKAGAVMSLHSAFTQLGYSLGAALGGVILLYADWSLMGLTLPIIGVLGALVMKGIKNTE